MAHYMNGQLAGQKWGSGHHGHLSVMMSVRKYPDPARNIFIATTCLVSCGSHAVRKWVSVQVSDVFVGLMTDIRIMKFDVN